MKSYNLVNGTCKDCTLFRECEKNKTGILKFLNPLGIKCVNGKRVAIVIDSSNTESSQSKPQKEPQLKKLSWN